MPGHGPFIWATVLILGMGLSLCLSKDMAGDGNCKLTVAALLPVLLAPEGDHSPTPGASIPKEQPSPTGVKSD